MKKMNTGQWVESPRAMLPTDDRGGRDFSEKVACEQRGEGGERKSTKTWQKNILGRKNSKHQVLTLEGVTTVQGMRRNRKVGLEKA